MGHAVDDYARAVVAGEVPAGKYHRLACERHLRDRAREGTAAFPFRFDAAKADRFFRFAERLKHYKGEWAGQLIRLEAHQRFRLGSLFGWVHASTGLRRFRNAYHELPRKNGKSLEAAVVTLYVTFFDGEPGAEGYCLDPTTRVLLADLRWRQLGDINVGDKLVSVDEQVTGFRKHRKMRVATVLGKVETETMAVRLYFDTGAEVTCSVDHRWLSQSTGANGFRFRSVKELQPGYRVSYLGTPWQTGTSWEAGYLSGLYDGEGYLHAPKSAGAAFRIGFSQKPGAVLDMARCTLQELGFNPKVARPHAGGTMEMELAGLHQCLRFLGEIRPRRLTDRARDVWVGKKFPGSTATLTRIQPLRVDTLVDIETSTGTFIAEGLVSHNCAATKHEQAQIVFNDCKKLVLSSGLKSRLVVQVANIHHVGSASKLEPLSADYDSMDGLNPSMVNIDEMHAHKNRGVIDVLETATGARRQPVINKITTAGNDPVSPCGDEHDYACKVLDGVLVDESYFAFIAHADPEDDWMLPETARKANPNYGVSVSPEDLAAKVLKAQGIPAAAASYKQKHLNLWVNTFAPSLSVEGWQRGQSEWTPEEMAGEACFVGIDLGTKLDLCAMAFVFPPSEDRETFRVVSYLWTPEETLFDRAHADRAPYDVWVREGWLLTTPGASVNHQVIREVLRAERQRFTIREIGFDGWHAEHLQKQLVDEDGFDLEQVITVPQSYQGLSAAHLRVKGEVLAGHMDARGCPVTAWAVSNVVEQTDGKGNIFFTKKRSRGRIDPVMAIGNALHLYLRHAESAAPQYLYGIYGGVAKVG